LISSGDIEKIKEWYQKQPHCIDDYGKKIEETDNYIAARIGYSSSVFLDFLDSIGVPENIVVFPYS
jgi:hypothetical protein